MRLIDANGLIDEICRDQCERKYKDCDSICEIAAYVVNAPTVGGWISVTDRLPEIGTPVLVAFDFGLSGIGGMMKCVDTAMLQDFGFCGGGYDNFCAAKGTCRTTVTHWMPLPEPPKEES